MIFITCAHIKIKLPIHYGRIEIERVAQFVRPGDAIQFIFFDGRYLIFAVNEEKTVLEIRCA